MPGSEWGGRDCGEEGSGSSELSTYTHGEGLQWI